MEKIHVYERDAYYYETDKMSVVHHSNYIRWFEEARVNFMKKVGYPYDFMESQGIMMPVLSAQCSYKNSVHFGDTVLIYASISKFNGFKMEVQYKICDKKTGELRANRKHHPLFYGYVNETSENQKKSSRNFYNI